MDRNHSTMNIIFNCLETIYMETVLIDLQTLTNRILDYSFRHHQNQYFHWVNEILCNMTRDYVYGKIFNESVQSIIRRAIHKHPNMNELSNLIIEHKDYTESKIFLNLVKKSIEPHFKNIKDKISKKMIFFIRYCYIDPNIYAFLAPYNNNQKINSDFKSFVQLNEINDLKMRMPKLDWIEKAINEYHSILQKR